MIEEIDVYTRIKTILLVAVFFIGSCAGESTEFYSEKGTIFSVSKQEQTPKQQSQITKLKEVYGENNVEILSIDSDWDQTFSKAKVSNELAANYINKYRTLSSDFLPEIQSLPDQTIWQTPTDYFLNQRKNKDLNIDDALLGQLELFDQVLDMTNISVASTPNGIIGSAIIADKTVAIRPIGNGEHALIDLSATQLPSDHGADGIEVPIGTHKKYDSDGLDDNGPKLFTSARTIRILNIISTKAHDEIMKRYSSVEDFIFDATIVTNASLEYHDLGYDVESAGIDFVDYNTTSYFMDVNNLADPENDTFKSVHTLRESAKADVVALFVDNQAQCGRAKMFNANYDTAFFVVNNRCAAAPKYSFAHELAHLINAWHNTEANNSGSYNHGYFMKNKKWRTIMSYDCEKCVDCEECDNCEGCKNCKVDSPGICLRYPQWSDPTKFLVSGEATGTLEYNDNARIWRENGAHMANLFENRKIYSTSISDPVGTVIADE